MRIAAFGDVHGNRYALQAVLQDARTTSPDAWVNLGDQLFGGADPAGAYELQREVRERHGATEVRGNTDERLGVPPAEAPAKREMLVWLHSVLPDGAAAHVSSLPLTAELLDGEVLAAHGSPRSAWDALLTDGDGWASDDAVRSRLEAYAAARVVLVGHTHREHLLQLGPVTVVNVGAVSRQKDGSPLARWALLERRAGAWQVSFRRVPYDVDAAARWARAHAHDGEREAWRLREGLDD